MKRLIYLIFVFIAFSRHNQAIASDPAASTMLLTNTLNGGRVNSAAFIVDREERWAITAYHYLNNAEKPMAILPTIESDAKVSRAAESYWKKIKSGEMASITWRWKFPRADLALIQIDSQLPIPAAIPLATNPIRTKHAVQAIGHPSIRNGYFEKNSGTVIGIQPMRWSWGSQKLSASILRIRGENDFPSGYSGGPVTDASGNLAGMILASPREEGLEVYAIEVTEIRSFLSRIYVLESWKAICLGQWKSARERIQKANALDRTSLLIQATRLFIDRSEN